MSEDEEIRTKHTFANFTFKSLAAKKPRKHKPKTQPENELRSVSYSTPRGKATAIPSLITHIIALQLNGNKHHQKLLHLYFSMVILEVDCRTLSNPKARRRKVQDAVS